MRPAIPPPLHRHGMAAVMLSALILVSGCSLDEVRQHAAHAQQRLEQAEDAVAIAQRTLAAASELAAQVDSERAQRAVQAASDAVRQAREALPVAQEAATATAEALEAAIAAREAGWGIADWLIALAGAALPAAGGIMAAIRARRWKDLAAHGIQLAQDLKQQARESAADNAAAKGRIDHRVQEAKRWQESTGARATVDRLRRKGA